MNIGPNIKQRREALGLSRNRAAHLAFVGWQRWELWETGAEKPGLRKLEDIARALQCEPADLLRSQP